MDFITLQNALVGVLVVVVVLLLSWLKSKGTVDAQAESLILAATQRAKDKYFEELAVAQGPDSDGGVTITPAEKSIARQHAFAVAMPYSNVMESIPAAHDVSFRPSVL